MYCMHCIGGRKCGEHAHSERTHIVSRSFIYTIFPTTRQKYLTTFDINAILCLVSIRSILLHCRCRRRRRRRCLRVLFFHMSVHHRFRTPIPINSIWWHKCVVCVRFLIQRLGRFSFAPMDRERHPLQWITIKGCFLPFAESKNKHEN